ncbi:D-alanyl-D-alanine carboxypeptidase/D-alanyl-D-alanine-endopeptidase [Rhodanobacter sp. C05]|uniref:D-alanyl-D-alanine carboxypeptidase/D-alanyl-D-alanine endopeptidase n=1 Tax=Rhodanobacter sp. C05 TaxID=1945855 RepID=UPI00098787B1|nr:D-alanyl-D-alanine carboxypeptidase/D-alanyl-D-alanine-endopeptidase [Rhodanobacter sp. C05]OOG40824.1 D-alanyl-D-alanine carboxypeptidase/D-alanyl-D-alanine-endopeptidase [Rhodanobacter sp. C05]
MSPSPSRFHHLIASLLLLVGICWLGTSLAAAPAVISSTTPMALAAQIDAHIDQTRFSAASWGIAVMSLDSGHMLYAYHADHLLQPASTAKLFTAALSLSTLGTDYRIPTRLLSRGRLRHGRLDGQLILYGMGDPTLGTAGNADWAERLAEQLAEHGVSSVRGDLIADDSYFTGPSFGSGWEAGDLQSWFAVPSSALSVQENVVDVTVTPGTAAGLPASLTLAPVDGIPSLLGQLTTTLPDAINDINLYRAPGTDKLYVFGSVPTGSTPQHFRVAMTDPALLAGHELRQALARHGIHISGQLQVLHWPQDDAGLLEHASTFGEVLSPPLLEILQRGLKRSQNLYLQNLLLNVGAREQARTAAPASGFVTTETYAIRALQPLLEQAGIPPSASMITEGTGLSRRDLVTPNALVRLLGYLAAQPYADQLRDALPIAGTDGTLINRMRQTAAAGNVHAKTGSMSSVHCLAGYVTSAAGERLAFAIMLNNYEPSSDAPSASGDLDTIAELLANYRGRE